MKIVTATRALWRFNSQIVNGPRRKVQWQTMIVPEPEAISSRTSILTWTLQYHALFSHSVFDYLPSGSAIFCIDILNPKTVGVTTVNRAVEQQEPFVTTYSPKNHCLFHPADRNCLLVYQTHIEWYHRPVIVVGGHVSIMQVARVAQPKNESFSFFLNYRICWVLNYSWDDNLSTI